MSQFPSLLPVRVAVGASMLLTGCLVSTATARFEATQGQSLKERSPGSVSPVRQQPARLAPYVATPEDVVQRMLRLARVTARDVVYDLGCGDGRIVIAAARDFGARGVGVDIDPQRIAEARANAASAGVADRVSFRLEDALTTDVSPATVVATYLLTASNIALRPRLTRQLAPGSRIVAHGFSMGDWEPATVETFTDRAGQTRTLYLWNADGRIRQ